MQRVGVSIRLDVKDVADIEYFCEQHHKSVSDWFREVISAELNKLRDVRAEQIDNEILKS